MGVPGGGGHGGVGLAISSSGVRTTIFPLLSRTIAISTRSALGSCNDEVFNGAADNDPLLSTDHIKDVLALSIRAPEMLLDARRRAPFAGERLGERLSALTHALE